MLRSGLSAQSSIICKNKKLSYQALLVHQTCFRIRIQEINKLPESLIEHLELDSQHKFSRLSDECASPMGIFRGLDRVQDVMGGYVETLISTH